MFIKLHCLYLQSLTSSIITFIIAHMYMLKIVINEFEVLTTAARFSFICLVSQTGAFLSGIPSSLTISLGSNL
jgi:shikimate kinase